MKNLLAIALGLMLAVSAMAQTVTTTTKKDGGVSAQSYTYERTSTQVSFVYLRDGYDNLAALNVPIKPLTSGVVLGMPALVTFNGIGAFDPNDLEHKIYVGTGLNLRLDVIPNKLAIDFVGGLKGFNIADGFKLEDAKRTWVFGVGAAFKF